MLKIIKEIPDLVMGGFTNIGLYDKVNWLMELS